MIIVLLLIGLVGVLVAVDGNPVERVRQVLRSRPCSDRDLNLMAGLRSDPVLDMATPPSFRLMETSEELPCENYDKIASIVRRYRVTGTREAALTFLKGAGESTGWTFLGIKPSKAEPRLDIACLGKSTPQFDAELVFYLPTDDLFQDGETLGVEISSEHGRFTPCKLFPS